MPVPAFIFPFFVYRSEIFSLVYGSGYSDYICKHWSKTMIVLQHLSLLINLSFTTKISRTVYEFTVYQMWPLLSEIFKSVCVGEACRLTELKLCSYIFNICPHQLAQGTWAPRAGWVPWKAQFLGLTAPLLHEQHSSTSTPWLLHDTLVTHSQTQSPPTQLATPF